MGELKYPVVRFSPNSTIGLLTIPTFIFPGQREPNVNHHHFHHHKHQNHKFRQLFQNIDYKKLYFPANVTLYDSTQIMDSNPIKTAIVVCNKLIKEQVDDDDDDDD